jgi:hypothetical protein
MRFRFSTCAFAIGVTLAGAVWSGGAIAQEAETVPWCVDDARLWPDGAAVKFDTRYLRICQPWFGPASGRQALLGVSAAVIPGSENAYAPLNLTLSSRSARDEVKANMLQFLTLRGTRAFGPVTYEAYESYRDEVDTLPVRGLYIFEGDSGQPWPPHWVNCSHEVSVPTGGMEACNVWVWYTDHLSATLVFHRSLERKDVRAYFPFFAREIVKVLEAVDVTDDLPDLEGRIEIVE